MSVTDHYTTMGSDKCTCGEKLPDNASVEALINHQIDVARTESR